MSGFAYLFERFPSFTQTFCFREVAEMRRLGEAAPVFSVRSPVGEPPQDFCRDVAEPTVYLPERFDGVLRSDAGFRRAARRWIAALAREWGDESEKRRIYEALWIAPRLRALGAGHVHVHFAGIAARTAYWLKKIDGVRFSFTAHANDIFCDEPHDRLARLVAEASAVATVSEFSAGYLASKFPAHRKKIFRAYNGIDPLAFRRERAPRNPPEILAVGRYIEKKGFAHLVEACALLGDRPFRCRIVGEGPLEGALRLRVESLGLGGRVEIAGPKPSGEIADALGAASIFALPCIDLPGGAKDNLPTVIMEAMAAGLPVVSTPVAGVPEMVVDGQTGILVPEADPTALAAALARLLDRPDEAQRMGEAGRALCVERFAVVRTAAHLRERLLAAGAGGPRRKKWWLF